MSIVYAAALLLLCVLAGLAWFVMQQRRELFVKATVNGCSYVVPLNEIGVVIEDVRTLKPDDTLTIEILPLRRADFERMPEFKGW